MQLGGQFESIQRLLIQYWMENFESSAARSGQQNEIETGGLKTQVAVGRLGIETLTPFQEIKQKSDQTFVPNENNTV